jgi:virulence plasmid B protein
MLSRPRQTQQQERPTASSSSTSVVTASALSLPKGGCAIRGIGEKFAAYTLTSAVSMTVSIATSPGRSGLGPQLNPKYDSGSGNGPFGFGWSPFASGDHQKY